MWYVTGYETGFRLRQNRSAARVARPVPLPDAGGAIGVAPAGLGGGARRGARPSDRPPTAGGDGPRQTVGGHLGLRHHAARAKPPHPPAHSAAPAHGRDSAGKRHHPDRDRTTPPRDRRRNRRNRGSRDRGALPRGEPLRSRVGAAPPPRPDLHGNARLHRRAIRGRRSAYYARVHRAAPDAGLFRRSEADRSGPGCAGNDQGAAQPTVHARCARGGGID